MTAKPSTDATAKPADKPLVVCVDDDPDMLASVMRCLRREQLTVKGTLSAREALSWVASQRVAVLVSDFEMPEMTGAQLTGEAKLIRPETVRILLTGRRTLDTAVEGINHGEIFRFISKPFDVDTLRREVMAAVAKHVELMAISESRDLGQRRAQLRAELDAEFPGISDAMRDPDGAYRITINPWEDAAGLGLDAIRDAATRRR